MILRFLGRLALVVLGIGTLWIVFSPAAFPRYVYTDLRTELVFDGQTVVVEGRSVCKRTGATAWGWMISVGFLPKVYTCSPDWLVRRMTDGSALFVGAFNALSRFAQNPKKISGEQYRDEYWPEWAEDQVKLDGAPRAVVWIDDVENPTRGEYYYSTEALTDPRSRLTTIKSTITSASARSFIPRSASDPADEAPWFGRASAERLSWEHRLIGYYALAIPEARWSVIPGLVETVAPYREPVVFLPATNPELAPPVAPMPVEQYSALNRLREQSMASKSSTHFRVPGGRQVMTLGPAADPARSLIVQPMIPNADMIVSRVDDQTSGILPLVPYRFDPALPTHLNQGRQYQSTKRYRIGNTVFISMSSSGHIVYDPATRVMLWITKTLFPGINEGD